MKKIFAIIIVVIGAVSAFGFVLMPTTQNDSPITNVKTGADKTGFTETTSW